MAPCPHRTAAAEHLRANRGGDCMLQAVGIHDDERAAGHGVTEPAFDVLGYDGRDVSMHVFDVISRDYRWNS